MKKLYMLLLLAAVLLSACQPQTEVEVEVERTTPITLCILHPEMNAFHASISHAVTQKGGELNWWIVPYTAGVDAALQLNQMENCVALGVDAILITPVDAQSICAGVRKAEEAGIPVYGIDRSTVGCEINMTVQADNEMAGRQGAQGAINFLTEKNGEPRGTVLELQGDMASNVAQLRNKGFKEEMAKYPDVVVISKPTEWDQDKFYRNTLDVVGSQPIDAIFSHTDVIGTTPIISALDQLGLLYQVGHPDHSWYGAVDGSPTGLQAIRDGWQDESYSQPNTDTPIVLDYVKLELEGGEIKEGIYELEGALWSPATIYMADNGWMMLLATTIVTPENVDDARLWGNG